MIFIVNYIIWLHRSVDQVLFAALSVGLTPEAVPRIASVEVAVGSDAVMTFPVDPYGCNSDNGSQTPGTGYRLTMFSQVLSVMTHETHD